MIIIMSIYLYISSLIFTAVAANNIERVKILLKYKPKLSYSTNEIEKYRKEYYYI